MKAYAGLRSSCINFSRSLKHPNEQIELRMSVSTADIDGMTWVCTTSIIGSSSSNSLLPPAVTQGCLLISDNCKKRKSHELFLWCTYRSIALTVNLFSGFTSIIPRKRFWQSGGTKCGMWKTPRFTFSSSCLKLSSSNGKAPTNKAYKITPQDQTSARRPSYFSP